MEERKYRIRGLTGLNMGRDEIGPHDTEADVETENTESQIKSKYKKIKIIYFPSTEGWLQTKIWKHTGILGPAGLNFIERCIQCTLIDLNCV